MSGEPAQDQGYPGQGVAAIRAWKRVGQQVRRARSGTAAYALGDQIVFSFGNMVVAACVSRHCSASAFGIYILTQRVLDVLIQLSNGLLWTPYTFALPALDAERKRSYRGSVLLWQIFFCLCFSLVLWAVSFLLKTRGLSSLSSTFSPLVLTGAGVLFREFTRRLYFADLRIREAFWTDVSTVVLQTAGVLLLAGRGCLDVPRALMCLCFGSIAVSCWWALRDLPSWRLEAGQVFGDFRKDLKEGRWLLGGNLIALASAQCNPWVLEGLLGSASVGAYSISESLINIPRAALTSMQNMMGPLVARAFVEEGSRGVRRCVTRMNLLLLGASTAATSAIWLLSPVLSRLIYRSAPVDVHIVTGVLAINLVAFVSTLAQGYGLMAFGRARAVLYANLVGFGVQALVTLPLVRSLHVSGAALALLCANLAVAVVRSRCFAAAMEQPANEGSATLEIPLSAVKS